MTGTLPTEEKGSDRIVLGLLTSVEVDGARSQRRIAAELGVALGLVNAYLKRCVNKGLVKVRQAPARRYAYYLTPQGFAEKSRLTVEYLSYSFSFFRRARADCTAILETARDRGWTHIVIAGVSDLAEISAICALESGIEIRAVVDAASNLSRFVGLPVVRSYDAVEKEFDGVVVTDLTTGRETFDAGVGCFGVDRVLAPSLLRLSVATK